MNITWTDQAWTTSADVLQSNYADGLEYETLWFGEGEERLAKENREINTISGGFVGQPLVAKSSILERNQENEKTVHKGFVQSQMKSQELAALFNETLEYIPGVKEHTPRI